MSKYSNNYQELSELLSSVKRGDIQATEELLSWGADVNAQPKRGKKALFLAAEIGHIEIVKALLKGGADVNGQTKSGGIALVPALYKGNIEL